MYSEGEALVEADGFAIPRRPETDDIPPGLPADITQLHDKDLMKLMSKLVAWLEYMGVRLVRGEIEERELDLQVNSKASTLISSAWTGASSDRVSIAKAEAQMDSSLLALKEKHLVAQTYRKLMQTLYDTTERKISIVSRELTRRTSIEPYKNRTNKFGGA